MTTITKFKMSLGDYNLTDNNFPNNAAVIKLIQRFVVNYNIYQDLSILYDHVN